jgi:hypothetical protein
MRRRLIDALDAIYNTRSRITYRQAFEYLGTYVCKCGHDPALARAFERAGRALERSGQVTRKT